MKFANEVIDRQTKKGIRFEYSFSQPEVELLTEFLKLRTREHENQIKKGLWQIIENVSGSIPSSMEGATLCYCSNKLYLFGGFSRDVYDELKI
jgi:hypothetical protein